jgi:hypothetical protein
MSEEKSNKDKREERNGAMKKGANVVGMRKMMLKQLIEESESNPDLQVFVLTIGVGEHCRNSQDIRQVMRDGNIMGTIYPMRLMSPVTQKAKTVTMFE